MFEPANLTENSSKCKLKLWQLICQVGIEHNLCSGNIGFLICVVSKHYSTKKEQLLFLYACKMVSGRDKDAMQRSKR